MKKNITVIGCLLIMLSGLSSCKKYLDYQSPSKLNIDQTFEDVNYTNSQIIGIYNKLAGSNGYGNQLSGYFGLGTDEFTYQANPSFDFNSDYAIANYGTNANTQSLYNVFVQLYAGVERANVACKYIPLSNKYKSGTADERAKMGRYYGEALALRAQYYYELIRNWGDVPGNFVPAADMPTQFMKNSNRDSTYDRIIADLKIAEDLVPYRDLLPEYVDYRFTKGAIKALRARIALARGGYSLRNDTRKMERRADYLTYYKIAYDECLEVIESRKHGLNPVYENIFKSLHTPTGRLDGTNELMFEVAMWGQINDSNIGSAFGLSFANSPSWGNAGGRSVAVPTYFYEFENGKDLRRDVTISNYAVVDPTASGQNLKIPRTSINLNINKFRKSWTGFNGQVTGTYGVNWPVIRYADVLLMYAEAANELGLSGSITPLDALQQVQRRAYGANTLPLTPTDHDGFFNAIVKERLLEFGGEGIRKYDLIRWNLLESKIVETKQKLALFAVGAPTANNPYNNAPTYLFHANVLAQFQNTDLNTEAATINLLGGLPNTVYYTPTSLTSAPTGYTRILWRQELGSYTNGVLTSTYLTDPNRGYVVKFEANKKELLPYHQNILTENRGAIVQNFGYN